MVSLKDKLKNIESFIKKIRIHTEKYKKYGMGDPYTAGKYKKEINGFTFEAEQILAQLNNHDKTWELKDELSDAVDEFNNTIDNYYNPNI